MSDGTCPGSDHRPPRNGGSCGCGMVTLVPARRPDPLPEIRDLLARCLHEGPFPAVPSQATPSGATTASALLREQADRLLTALAEAGLVLAPRRDPRLPA